MRRQEHWNVVRHHRSTTLGKDSLRRLQLIERNRLLLAIKLFPASLLLLNPLFFAMRLAAGLVAAHRGRGDTAHFPGFSGKWKMARALFQGDLEALRLTPRIWRKRAAINSFRQLDARDIWRLIFANRLPLTEVA